MLSNICQIFACYDFTAADIAFNPSPIFHAFGLTGGLVLGLMTGMKVFLYPTPLHYRQIPELVYRINAMALFGTDTFSPARRTPTRTTSAPCATWSAAREINLRRDPTPLSGAVRPQAVRRLRRHRGVAGAGGQHANVQPRRLGRPPAAGDRKPRRARRRHRGRRPAVGARPQHHGRLPARRQSRRDRAAAARLARHRRHRRHRPRRLRLDPRPRQALRQHRRRDGVARRRRGDGARSVARQPAGRRRRARPPEGRAHRHGDDQSRARPAPKSRRG